MDIPDDDGGGDDANMGILPYVDNLFVDNEGTPPPDSFLSYEDNLFAGNLADLDSLHNIVFLPFISPPNCFQP